MKTKRWTFILPIFFLFTLSLSCSDIGWKLTLARISYFVNGVRWLITVDPDTMKMGRLIEIENWGYYPWQGEEKLKCVVRGIDRGKLRVNGKVVGILESRGVEEDYRIHHPENILIFSGSRLPKELQKCSNLVSVELGRLLEDSTLEFIRDAENLRVLDFGVECANISEEGYAIISGFKRLERLRLWDDTLGGTWDEKARIISGMTNLKGLFLNAGVSDTGLALLGNLKKSEEVELWFGKYTGEGFKTWDDFSNLQELKLYMSTINDQGLKTISNIKSLRRLQIQSDSITDDGLRCLENLPDLEFVIISGAKITDQGRKYLQSLGN